MFSLRSLFKGMFSLRSLFKGRFSRHSLFKGMFSLRSLLFTWPSLRRSVFNGMFTHYSNTVMSLSECEWIFPSPKPTSEKENWKEIRNSQDTECFLCNGKFLAKWP